MGNNESNDYKWQGGIYKGHVKGRYGPHGDGKIIYPDYTFYGTWELFPDKLYRAVSERHGDGVYRWKNSSKKLEIRYDQGKALHSKMTVHITPEDFKLDIPYLTEFLLNPKNYPDGTECYDMIFEGEFKNKIPVKGDFYISKIFQFNGVWRDGLVHCKSIVYDTKNRKQRQVHYIDGIEMLIEPVSREVSSEVKRELSGAQTRAKQIEPQETLSNETQVELDGKAPEIEGQEEGAAQHAAPNDSHAQ